MPTLSVDALQLNVNAVCVCPLTTSPVGTEGACVSAQALVEVVSAAFAERLPAASAASTESV